MKFNRDIFFNLARPIHWRWCKFGLSQNQVDGLNFLLTQIERDAIWKELETVAYALATTAWETAWTFQPIDERGGYAYFERRYGFQTKVGKRLGNDTKGEGAKYHGRGDVQLTGETNYENAEKRLREFYPSLIAEFETRTLQKFDLTDTPDQAKDSLIAYAIMALGMHQGWFTDKSFSSYKKNRYLSWRRIINGTDHANDIASIAEAFEKALRAAYVSDELTAESETPVAPNSLPNTSTLTIEMPSISANVPQQIQPSINITTTIAEKAEEIREELKLPELRLGGYANKAQETIAEARETIDEAKEQIGAAVDAYDKFKEISRALGTGRDSAKSLWSTVAQAIYQAAWAIAAFFLGLPLEVWIVVAIVVAAIGLMYLYRQISLGKLRETARLELIKIVEFLK